ncbi:hypothetical protein [Tepidiforma sp.]|uniref:hypothetical protein n=1 Tax=Tepidiforma sp. TaxID=2682230 RepID=UPI0021DD1E34|nr:hypothetical protein [Tepidiforma sp.]MCX7617767.1 hypothetical protein [Tepidiforma sp.]GIW18558.1 MAG: hypothetical protein KatS3mg064_1715 [Tepidiforma sp.]
MSQQSSHWPLTLTVLSALVVLGSVGPWASVLFVTVNGTEGDGAFTAVFGGVGILLAALSFKQQSRWKYGAIAGLGGISAVIGVIDWADIASEPESEMGFGVQVEWGLVLMTLAAMAKTVAGGAAFWGLQRSAAADRAAAPAVPAAALDRTAGNPAVIGAGPGADPAAERGGEAAADDRWEPETFPAPAAPAAKPERRDPFRRA